MMHGHEKSRSAIVAVKPTNKVARPLRSSPRRSQPLRSRWSQGRRPRGMRASKARTGRSTGYAWHRRWLAYGEAIAVDDPRWEPYAGKLHVRICAGGAQ